MIKNLKVDIIYNNTPADFEFEFNLGGYCRSRILNAKSTNNKELVTKLAIAVSRSRVIIIVGKLLGENGTVEPVAKSISKEMATVDHRQYHITSPEPISLIEGSLPLVTSDGEFGGCIIESGPQSIIFLTENKAVRARIMEQLVSHYISSLSRTPDDENNLIIPQATVAAENTQEENVQEIAQIEEPEAVITDTETNEMLEISNDNAEDEETVLISETTEQEIVAEFSNVSEEFDNLQIIDFEDFSEQQYEYEADEDNQSFIIPMTTLVEDNEPIEKNQNVVEDTQSKEIEEVIKKIKSKKSRTINSEIKENKFIKKDITEPKSVKYNTQKTKSKKSKVPSKLLIALLAILLIVVAILAYILIYLPGLDGISASEYFKEIFAAVRFGGLL